MSNESSGEAWVESLFRTENDQFADNLSMLYIIDVGTIVSIDANNRATVNTSRMIGGSIAQLKDIEVIGLGNNNGAFMVDGNNCACLILAPRTCMPNVRNTKINLTANPYDKGGIKALPISNGASMAVRATFTSEGSLTIVTDGYMVCFEKERIACTGVNGFTISLDDEGELYFYRKTEQSGELSYKIDDTGIIGSFTNSENTSIYDYSLLNTGVLTLTHKQPQAGQDPIILNQVSVNDDGSLSITASDKIKITIDADGNISLTTEGTLGITSKGNMSLTSTEGNIAIESTQGNVTIDSKATGKNVSINGTNLKVDK